MAKKTPTQIINSFKRDIVRKDAERIELMLYRWLQVERALDNNINVLSQEIADRIINEGRTPTAVQIMQMERYKALMNDANAEVSKYQRWANVQIKGWQADNFDDGRKMTDALFDALTPAGVDFAWNRINKDAVEAIIGMCADGAPLFDVLKNRSINLIAVEASSQKLIEAVALGYNPRKTAEMMAAGLTAGLEEALLIARTEQARAFRYANDQVYKANRDMLNGWVWSAALDDRTCASCWAMHGTLHAVDEELDDHPNGRCVKMPITKSWRELGYDIDEVNPAVRPGAELFAELSPDRQANILSPAKLAAYNAGAIDITDLVGQKQSDVWGSTRYELSLTAVLGEEAKQYME